MRAKSAAKRAKSNSANWQDLTCDDLEDWTDEGSLKRGKAYFTDGHVQSFALTRAGEVVAWVQGNERYAVRVAIAPPGEHPRLISLCSCPVGYGCKHAVAAVLAYFDAVARGKEIPVARPNDPRRLVAAGEPVEDSYEPANLREAVAAKSHEELVELVLRLAEQVVTVRDGLDECARLILDPDAEEFGPFCPPLPMGKHAPRVYHG